MGFDFDIFRSRDDLLKEELSDDGLLAPLPERFIDQTPKELDEVARYSEALRHGGLDPAELAAYAIHADAESIGHPLSYLQTGQRLQDLGHLEERIPPEELRQVVALLIAKARIKIASHMNGEDAPDLDDMAPPKLRDSA
ncbi:MAG: hypothetical protein KDD70_13230 [Bdellovibrionales bacterium]|nr:hypothetical protein [Bdellovibrionales bacterium]